MKGSIVIVAFFFIGCLAGYSGLLPETITDGHFAEYVLFLLMFVVGTTIGSDSKLPQILRQVRPAMLLVPAATIIGTLAFSMLASVIFSQWSIGEVLAVGSGFGYYSLSSILIAQIKEPSIGIQAATQLSTIALLANIIRELTALLTAPWLVRYFGRLAPICVGGATTIDTTLPVITKYSGKELTFIAILHGILVDLSVPILVPLFASL